jgi:hypothetical protein
LAVTRMRKAVEIADAFIDFLDWEIGFSHILR